MRILGTLLVVVLCGTIAVFYAPYTRDKIFAYALRNQLGQELSFSGIKTSTNSVELREIKWSKHEIEAEKLILETNIFKLLMGKASYYTLTAHKLHQKDKHKITIFVAHGDVKVKLKEITKNLQTYYHFSLNEAFVDNVKIPTQISISGVYLNQGHKLNAIAKYEQMVLEAKLQKEQELVQGEVKLIPQKGQQISTRFDLTDQRFFKAKVLAQNIPFSARKLLPMKNTELDTFFDEFIKRGTIQSADIDINLDFFSERVLVHDNLYGKVIIKDFDFTYSTYMPDISDAVTSIKIDGTKVLINIDDAKIKNTIVNKGVVTLDWGKEKVVDVDATASGPAKDLIEFIEPAVHDKLKKNNLDFANLQGKATTKVKLKIPLDETPNTYDVKVEVPSLSWNTYANKLQLTNARIEGAFDGKTVKIKTHGSVSGFVGSTKLTVNLDDKIEIGHTIEADLVMQAKDLENQYAQVNSGFAKTHITYIGNKNKDNQIKITSDLENLDLNLPWIDFHKPSQIKAHATIDATIAQDDSVTARVDVTSDIGFSASGILQKNKQGFIANDLKMTADKKQFLGSLKYTDGLVEAKISGRGLDLSKIDLLQSLEKQLKHQVPDAPKQNIKVKLALEHVKMKNDIEFSNLFAALDISDNKLNDLYFCTDVGTKHLLISANSKKAMALATNAGAVFRAFDLTDKIRSGVIAAGVNHSDFKNIQGSLALTKFISRKNSVLTRIGSSLAMQSWINTILSKDEMVFRYVSSDIIIKDDIVILRDLKTSNPYLNFVFDGSIDTTARKYSLRGMVMPVIVGIDPLMILQAVPAVSGLIKMIPISISAKY